MIRPVRYTAGLLAICALTWARTASAAPLAASPSPAIDKAPVVLDGRTAQSYLIIELPSTEHILLREAIDSLDASCFANTDLRTECGKACLPVSWHSIVQEAQVFKGLLASLHFRPREQIRVGRIDDITGCIPLE